MKIKELRIGNLVYGGFEDDEENSNHSVCVVTGLSEDQHLGEGWNFMLENMERKDVENYFEMKPIPLTEEWLLKFGFNRKTTLGLPSLRLTDNSYLYAEKFKNDDFYTVNLCVEGIDANDLSDEFDLKLNITQVHRLQNFVFSVKGEEFELK